MVMSPKSHLHTHFHNEYLLTAVCVETELHTNIPFSVETHGPKGAPAVQMLTRLGVLAAEASGSTFPGDQFAQGPWQGDAVSLCMFNARLDSTVAGFFALVAGGV